ncbi:M14 family zinc carboxypeptidase [Bacterioplanes sanyensis]|nr:M14 family zinc carboxypeptidase [Bacterioplanes sanyensis]
MQSLPASAGDHHAAEIQEQEAIGRHQYKVVAPSEDLAVKAKISFHAQLISEDREHGHILMSLTAEEVEKLKAFGFEVTLEPVASPSLLDSSSAPLIGPNAVPGFSCYKTVEETYAAAEDFEQQYPDLVEWIDVGNSWQKNAGNGGYDIKVLKLTNKNNSSANKPVLFANSAIHARELATAPLNLDFARYLLEGYGTDADATWILDHHEVHLMLQSNPDGRKRAESQANGSLPDGYMWRKNDNSNYCSSSSRSRGADLNRNFTFSWGSVNGGSSGNPCDFTYRGPTPGSEPETQAIEGYIRNLWPDLRGPGDNDAAPATTSGIHIDIHSFSELVLWPWGTTSQPAPNGTALQTLGRKFAFFNGYMPQQSVGLYPTDGTSDSVSYGELGVPSYTFELGTAFRQSCSSYASTIKPDNLPALIYAAKVVRTPYITPAGPDVLDITLSGDAASTGVLAGTAVDLRVSTSDTRFSSRNGSEGTQTIQAVEYYIGKAPWEPNAVPTALAAEDGSFNQKTEAAVATIDTTGLPLGKHLVYIRAQDANGTWGAVSAEFINIVDDVPAGNYCDAKGTDFSYEWIEEVRVGAFSKNSGQATQGYSDFTSEVINLSPGSTSFTLTPGFNNSSGYRERWKIWLDLNADGDFDDAGETLFSSASGSSAPVNSSFTLAAPTQEVKTRMRIAMRYNNAPSVCGDFDYGEVEDYSVVISPR